MPDSPSPSIVWFRRDLRLADNPALLEAAEQGGPVIPVYIWAPGEEAPWEPGGASRWWLHNSLRELSRRLHAKGSRLILRHGPSEQALRALIEETGARAVFWNRLYDPAIVERDTQIKKALREAGIETHSRNAALLFEPWTIATGSGDPYKVFTPFWRRCLQEADPAEPYPEPSTLPGPKAWPDSVPIEELELLPRIDWADGLRDAWTPGEEGGLQNLESFSGNGARAYSDKRNTPGERGTSRLSPHLHWGEIGPRQVWYGAGDRRSASVRKFLAEIGWREFAHHLLFHFPHTAGEPLRAEFKEFPWRESDEDLRAWQRGQTGYPIVDAGMRELWTTGWMHNRVRMIVSSFLVKHLLISWQEGARWFWDTLVDADLASNTLGWQWAGGCGADAAPYFRIFNPILQGEKFDPDGVYTRQWVPEVANLPNKYLFKPWEAKASPEQNSGYPCPIVDHRLGRDRALRAFDQIKKNKRA